MTITIFEVKEKELYGSEIPQTEDDFRLIQDLGIKVIISLAGEIETVKQQFDFTKDFEHIELFIEDYTIPTEEQVRQFIELLRKYQNKKKPVLVHCIGGCGRTGVMLALAERFLYGVQDGKEAIARIRTIRSCAVETQEQEDFVINFQL